MNIENIVLITVDQERYFKKWPEGLELPGRQRLMDMGVTFDRHYIASSVCTPSRSVMYTGHHVPATHMFDNVNFSFVPPMSPKLPTIGHMLRQLNYYTAYKGKWHLNMDLEPDPERDHDYSKDMDQYGFSDFNCQGDSHGRMLDGYHADSRIAEDSVTWLRTKGLSLSAASTPWFLSVNFVNPHDIMYFVPGQDRGPDGGGFPTIGHAPNTPQYHQTYPESVSASYTQKPNEVDRPRAHFEFAEVARTFFGDIPPEESAWKAFQDYYFNCLADVDRHICRILDELENQKLLKNTAIVFTSDHGELAGAHGLWGKGGFAYEENCHVPFIVYTPDGPSGLRCRAVTSHVDLAPTIVGLSQGSQNKKRATTKDLPGHDLTSLIYDPGMAESSSVRNGALFTYNMVMTLDAMFLPTFQKLVQSGAPREAIKEALAPYLEKRGFVRMIIDERYKYSRYFAPVAHNRPESLEEILALNDIELFDTIEDPGEMSNIAANPEANRDLILEMNSKLNSLIDTEIGVDDGAYLPGHKDTDWYINELDHDKKYQS